MMPLGLLHHVSGLRCRFCVSQNPQIEAKIVQELDSLGLLATSSNPQPRELQHEDLSKLTYLNMVIKVCGPCASKNVSIVL